MSRIADILTALVAAINTEDFSQDFTAVRAYTTRIDVSAAGALQVLVVPKSRSSEISTREAFDEDPAIDIGIIKRLDKVDNASVDAMMLLVEEIGDFCKRLQLATTPAAMFVKLEVSPLYDQAMLKESSVFFSVITVTFRQIV